MGSKQRGSGSVEPDRDAFEIRVHGQISDAIVSGLGAERRGASDTALIVDLRDQAEIHAFLATLAQADAGRLTRTRVKGWS